jgi:hypothetical protein
MINSGIIRYKYPFSRSNRCMRVDVINPLNNGQTSVWMSSMPVFNNDIFKAPMNTALCYTLPVPPHLLHAHGCSLVLRFASCFALAARPWIQLRVLRACCHAYGHSFVLHARFASRAHTGIDTPEGTTFACAPLSRLLI